MPRDAKFGLVVGVCLVVLITILFLRHEPGDTGTRASANAVSTKVKKPQTTARPQANAAPSPIEPLMTISRKREGG